MKFDIKTKLKQSSLILLMLISYSMYGGQNFETLYQQAMQSATKAGHEVTVANQATLKVPTGHVFIPRNEAVALSESMGNLHNELLQGLIVPSDSSNEAWMIYVAYEDSGYITDDDKDSLNPDQILEMIRKSTDVDNNTRRANGMGELTVEKWLEKPNYNKENHQLVWSILAKEDDIASGNQNSIVNYKADMLGRQGKFSFVMVTGEYQIEDDKKNIRAVLSNMNYNKGKRYEDFLPGSDKLAGYGLIALVAGVATKKIGLLAMVGILLLKVGKFLLLLPMIFANKIKKLFSKNK